MKPCRATLSFPASAGLDGSLRGVGGEAEDPADNSRPGWFVSRVGPCRISVAALAQHRPSRHKAFIGGRTPTQTRSSGDSASATRGPDSARFNATAACSPDRTGTASCLRSSHWGGHKIGQRALRAGSSERNREASSEASVPEGWDCRSNRLTYDR